MKSAPANSPPASNSTPRQNVKWFGRTSGARLCGVVRGRRRADGLSQLGNGLLLLALAFAAAATPPDASVHVGRPKGAVLTKRERV